MARGPPELPDPVPDFVRDIIDAIFGSAAEAIPVAGDVLTSLF